jgi:tRNA(Ile)-lysidine synthase TilS/MesJ
MKKICSEINTILQEKCSFEVGATILCPTSGGQDSILTLFSLLYAQPIWNLKIQLLYCHHFWQKDNFLAFWYLWKLAYIFQIPFTIILAEFKIENEENAHYWRRNCFHRMNSFYHCLNIFLGHTATDYFETSLLNLMRGTSPRGCTSLQIQRTIESNNVATVFSLYTKILKKPKTKPVRQSTLHNKLWNVRDRTLIPFFVKKKPIKDQLKKFQQCYIVKREYFFPTYSYILTSNLSVDIRLIRPLLMYHRNDITKIVKHYQLPVFIDFTNKTLVYSRNRVRYILMPILRKVFYNNFDFTFNNFLHILLDEQIYLEEQIHVILKQTHMSVSAMKIITPSELKTYPVSIQRQLLYQLCTKYCRRQQIVGKTIEKIRLMGIIKKSGLPGTRTRN